MNWLMAHFWVLITLSPFSPFPYTNGEFFFAFLIEKLLLSTSQNTSSGSAVLVISEIQDGDQSSSILSSSTIYNETSSSKLPHMMQSGAVCAKCQKSDHLHQALFSYER